MDELWRISPKMRPECHRERSDAISGLLRRLWLTGNVLLPALRAHYVRPNLLLQICLAMTVPVCVFADGAAYELGGHTKLRMTGQTYPSDSLFRDLVGSSSVDTAGELRLNLAAKTNRWSFHADYQLLGLNSEFLPLGMPNDERRPFDFTKTISES